MDWTFLFSLISFDNLGSLLRWGVTALVTWLIASGWVPPETKDQLIAALVLVGTLLWSVYKNHQTAKAKVALNTLPAGAMPAGASNAQILQAASLFAQVKPTPDGPHAA